MGPHGKLPRTIPRLAYEAPRVKDTFEHVWELWVGGFGCGLQIGFVALNRLLNVLAAAATTARVTGRGYGEKFSNK
eukprot:4245109-Amphidinium_carterae.1